MAITCLRRPGETRDIFSPDTPSEEELEAIKRGLSDGAIDERLLEKLFPMAYKEVSKNGVMEYYFLSHNKIIPTLERYTKRGLVEWCKAYPGTVIEKGDGGWLVERIDSKKFITDSEVYPGIKAVDDREIRTGSRVVIHRDKINLIVSKEEYQKIAGLYKKTLES